MPLATARTVAPPLSPVGDRTLGQFAGVARRVLITGIETMEPQVSVRMACSVRPVTSASRSISPTGDPLEGRSVQLSPSPRVSMSV